MKNQKSSDDPLFLRVIPQEIKIPLEQILARNGVEEDPLFVKKYQEYSTGKLDGYITRVSISRIKFGFYKWVSNKWECLINEPTHQEINACARKIRGGYRPSLDIYHNPNQDGIHDFVCPYNGAAFYAYSKLGINKPPVIVLGAKSRIEESALKIKGFKRTGNSYIHLIYASENRSKEIYPSSLGFELSDDAIIDLINIEKRLTQFKDKLRDFHVKGASDVDYHKIIYAMLNQTHEMLLSIRILVTKKLYIQAATIARSLYELSVNFYLIWLSPHAITPMILNASAISESEWQKQFDDYPEKSIEQVKKANRYQYNLVRSTMEKTKLSPFGEDSYKPIYSFLSDIVHHNFSMLDRYRNSLENGDHSVDDKDVRESIVRMVDACIGWMIVWLRGDIGSNVAISLEKH
jgi:hypothetical protein